MANKLLGQHFLIDKTIASKMASLADLKNGHTVLEVGPGRGALTEKLLETGARVLAVEKDKNLILPLKNKFSGRKNLTILEGDILSVLPGVTNSFKEYKVVANIPYYLTARLIRLLLESENQPQTIILMIQKEVAKKITAGPPKASLLSMSVAFFGQPRIAFFVPAKKFKPQPKVDSAVIQINPYQNLEHSKQYSEKFFKLLKAGFLSPRKTLQNNFKSTFKKDKIEIEQWFKKCGIRPNQRAQELDLQQWKCLVDNF